MRFASATDFAIAQAVKTGSLRIVERVSRFDGEAFFAIEDAFGVIEVAATRAEADQRVAGCA